MFIIARKSFLFNYFATYILILEYLTCYTLHNIIGHVYKLMFVTNQCMSSHVWQPSNPKYNKIMFCKKE